MENLLELIKPELLATIVVSLAAAQAVLAGIKKALELVKDKTASNLDNKIFKVVDFICKPLNSIVDVLQGNANKK